MASRNTAQRLIIEKTFFELANHPTAEQVYEAVRRQHPTIGKATVYRTLNLMCEDGKAQRVKVNNGPDCFDYQTFMHYHVRCTVCGRVEDVLIDADPTVDEQAARQTGFAIEGHVVQFDGVCPACRAASESAPCVAAGARVK